MEPANRIRRSNNDAINFFKNYSKPRDLEALAIDTENSFASSDTPRENVKHAIALRKSKNTHSDFYILLQNVNDQIAAFKTIFLTKTPKFMMPFDRSPGRPQRPERTKNETDQLRQRQRRKRKLETRTAPPHQSQQKAFGEDRQNPESVPTDRV